MLVRPGVQINELDASGRAPLHVAIDAKQQACVAVLVKAGADRNLPDAKGRTALEAAGQLPDPEDRTAMLRLLIPSLVLAGPASGNAAPPWSLEHAVQNSKPDTVAMLLKLGANPNLPGIAGTLPLHQAALKGNAESVRHLLSYGAKHDTVGKDGTQPIHEAALGDNPAVIQELLGKGADINVRTAGGDAQTPLHLAAMMGKMRAVQALVSAGADLTLKDSKGRTPYDAAQRAGLTEVATYLSAPR